MTDIDNTGTPDAGSITADGKASFDRAQRSVDKPSSYPGQQTRIVTHVGPKTGRKARRKS
jgi:hypothetical protein